MPERIQRQRTKGWRMPEGAIYVGRPSVWGNPFSLMAIGEQYPSLTVNQCAGMAVAKLRDLIGAGGILRLREGGKIVTYRYPIGAIRAELGGHDLACWCPLAAPCHADLLLELANA